MQENIKHILKITEKVKARYEELGLLISFPEIIADNRYWRKLVLERAEIESIALAHIKLDEYIREIEKYQVEQDTELAELYQEEIKALKFKIDALIDTINSTIIYHDDKDAIMEIRAAEGIDSGLFCSDILKMYERYAKVKNYKFTLDDVSYGDGIKHAIISISGQGALNALIHESGTHKAIGFSSATYKKANINAATVAVFPKMGEIEVDIKDKDIRIDIFNSSGAGGQNVNKVESAIRITHFPTGIVVTCQDERSQLKNRDRAMKTLRSKVYDYYKEKLESEYNTGRKKQIDLSKSDIIRTYNYTLSKAIDHRMELTLELSCVLNGELDTFLSALTLKENLGG